jgi:peptidoglycan/LPS O-acetylase OafA/YrhL
MFSIGRPFFLVGLAMLVLGPVRRRPALFWPPLLAVVAYNAGYWAVAPLYCTATEAVGGPSTTTCSSVLGINYSGSGIYNPSLDPANIAGLLLAAVAFVVVLVAIISKRRSERDVTAP